MQDWQLIYSAESAEEATHSGIPGEFPNGDRVRRTCPHSEFPGVLFNGSKVLGLKFDNENPTYFIYGIHVFTSSLDIIYYLSLVIFIS